MVLCYRVRGWTQAFPRGTTRVGFLFQKDNDGDPACELAIIDQVKMKRGRSLRNALMKYLRHREIITERNPVTNVYPFVLAASGDYTLFTSSELRLYRHGYDSCC